MDNGNLEIPELLSSSARTRDLALPDVKRIMDVRKLIEESKKFNGSIKKLTEFISNQEFQCRDIVVLLKEQVQLKLNSLRQAKDDMLDLRRQIHEPDPNRNFNINTKVLVKFSDETEMNECDMPEALVRYSLKMSSLYAEILALDSDVDYVSYLASVAELNKQYVQDWHKRDELNKAKLPMIKNKNSGDAN